MANSEKDQQNLSTIEFSQKMGPQIVFEARGFSEGINHLRHLSPRLPLWDGGRYLNLPTTPKKAA